MPSIRLLIVYHTQQESNVVCLSHEGELKFHDVISTLRYCHDICLKALESSRQESIWRQIYQLITVPS